ncbi:GNAT family N-acetyltransferase [Aquibacillus halophilus]|nr:GNAT family N-acetyltransferase [Aquibacillus halophilus]
MYISNTKNIETYTRIVEPLLLKKEACNNLSLGILYRFLEKKEKADEATPFLGLIKDNEGTLIYSFLQTPPHNLILADIDSIDSTIIEEIAQYLFKQGLVLPGVLGPTEYVEAFTSKWQSLSQSKAAVHMRQLIYQLDHVNSINYPSGQLVKASPDDKELIKNWLVLFGEEANEVIPPEHAYKLAERFVNNGSVYLWRVNGVSVSMVNQSRTTRNGTTINGVYTPDTFKRKGYATAAVAKLSEKLLDSGHQFCALYTDLDNPTSNNIYKKIGYQVVGDSTVFHFELIK